MIMPTTTTVIAGRFPLLQVHTATVRVPLDTFQALLSHNLHPFTANMAHLINPFPGSGYVGRSTRTTRE
jgi:hypothetical protein